MIDETTKYGHKYLSPSCCTYGNYGGAGSVGVANVRAILEMDEFQDSIFQAGYNQWERIGGIHEWGTDCGDLFECKEPPKVVHLTGGWGSNTLWLLECEETEDIIACLADYPLLDEELHSQVEMQWEEEAWDNWIRSELYDGLPEELQEAIDDTIPTDAKLYEAYRLAMESTNTYPTSEYDGVHVRVKDIQDEYEDNVRAILC